MDDNEDLDDSISRAYSHKPYANHNPSTSNPIPRKFRTRDPQFPRRNPNHFAEDDEESDDLDEDDAPEFYRHPKKRRLRSLNSTYELAPRVNGNKSEEEWSERGASVLLDVWGERFAELGRKSLRSEDWRDVAERVSDISGAEKSEIQCRKMMDSLKRRYKKEKKARVPGLRPSRWELFRKMDALLSPWQGSGLACGVDSGEFVFADTSVYLDQSNGYDEMRDSPAESEASDENEDGASSDADVAPAREASMRALACSIQKFGEIYGKVESSKRKQMAEIESMRRDFGRDLELQKKQIMERTRAEIARIREEDDDDEEEDEDGDSEDLSE